jgi:hypothetical protein
VAGLALALVVGVMGYQQVSYAWTVRGNDYDAYIAKIREHVPEGASVQAMFTSWYGLSDGPFWAHHHFRHVGPYEDAVREAGIEYILVDEYLTRVQIGKQRSIPADEVYGFLEEHAELVAVVYDPVYQRGNRTLDEYPTSIYRVLPAEEASATP